MSTKRKVVIVNNINEDLSSIPFHENVAGLFRRYAGGFPYHIAIHQMDENTSTDWVGVAHSHKFEEIDVILSGKKELRMEFEIAGKIKTIHKNKSILMPPNVEHKSRYLSGCGFLVCIILASSKEVFLNV